jgi:hypothetical protein
MMLTSGHVHRLRVPRYGAMLEFINFTLLMAAFVTCLIGM